MTRFHKHLFIHLSILAQAYSYVIDVNGELSLDMHISDVLMPFYERAMENGKDALQFKRKRLKDDHDYEISTEQEEKEVKEEEEKEQKVKKDKKEKVKEENDEEETEEEVENGKAEKEKDEGKEEKETNEDRKEEDQKKLSGVTAAPVVECLYQYPDMVQFNAMLSQMMNELTKVFVGVHKLMRKRDARRHQETRYKVVAKKDTRFFERIYNNMTKEYSQFYNNTAGRVARAAEDPCDNQEELKEVWRELLERSLSSLRRAALKCIDEFLRSSSRSGDTKARNKLEQYLSRELAKVRTSQLHMLCDSFQLCYNDLL